LACVTLIPIATYLGSSTLRKSYDASAIVRVQPSDVDTSLFDTSAGVATTQQAAVVAAAAKLVQTAAMAATVARALGRGVSPSALLSSTSVETDVTSGFITIHARDHSPALSARIANAFAGALVSARAEQARSQVRSAIRALAGQLASIKSSDQTTRSQLSQQLQRLRAVEAAQGNNAQVLVPASVPTSPASPKPVRDTVLALVIALMLSVALAFVLERLNRRIRTPHDFEELTRAPLLGIVPASAFNGRISASTDEKFGMIRATLLQFNARGPLKTILVSSPGVGEGKTTVAVQLALSLARSGKNVILVDCDLRLPQVASRLQLDHVDYGLAEVLSKERAHPLPTDLVEVKQDGAATLRVLPAGTPPANPAELLNSSRMRILLQYLSHLTQFVVLDSTPLLRVSDAVPLVPQVSGVIGLARMNRTRRDDIRRFQEVVTLSGGALLGIVASGVRTERDEYGYRYGYGHAEVLSADASSAVNGAPAGDGSARPRILD
jgi:capsular exopolysaccharide synthesis family protein